MDVLCNNYLVLEGEGAWATYADIDQWLKRRFGMNAQMEDPKVNSSISSLDNGAEVKVKAKLSYKDKKALETIEVDIEQAEAALERANKNLEEFQDFENKEALNQKIADVTAAQAKVTRFYELWDELESKK